MSPVSDPSFPGQFGGARSDEVHVTLPCAPDHFAEFITGLLGRPQTISRRFRMLFSVDRADLESLHHLIVQRIGQQNDATLVQFVAVITFDDHSSVRITSFDDFQRYNEVRPLRSVAVLLNWIFLIRFPDRHHPEKQEISIRFITPGYIKSRTPLYFDIPLFTDIIHYHLEHLESGGTIEVNVNFTARTWGNDVDNLLKGHIENLEKHDNPSLSWIIRHSGAVGFWVAVLLFAAGIFGSVIYAHRVDEVRGQEITQMFAVDRAPDAVTIDALKALLQERLLLGDEISGSEFFLFVCLASFLLATVLGVVTATVADAMARSSHVVLTKQSENHAYEKKLNHKRKVIAFVLIQVVNIVVGLAIVGLGNTITEHWAL